MPHARICVSLGSHVVWLETLQGMADDLAERVGFDEDARFEIGMALREGVNNAILHGNGRDGTKAVEVEIEIDEHGLGVRIRDEGSGFDAADIPDPLSPQNLMRSSGRGLFLIRHYMDELDVSRAGQSGGEIRMRKWLVPPEPAGES